MAELFVSSRWTQGNLIFPDTLSVQADGIHFEKRRFFGSSEELINFRQLASVKVQSGILFATLVIETSGGAQPVVMHGLHKSDAATIKNLIQQMQAQAA